MKDKWHKWTGEVKDLPLDTPLLFEIESTWGRYHIGTFHLSPLSGGQIVGTIGHRFWFDTEPIRWRKIDID